MSVPQVDYTRWGLTIAAHTTGAGKRIRWLPGHHTDAANLPADDFWMLDDDRVMFTVFEPNGRFAGGALTRDDRFVAYCRAVRDRLRAARARQADPVRGRHQGLVRAHAGARPGDRPDRHGAAHRLGVVPTEAEYVVPTNQFIVYDDRLVHVESVSAELTVNQPREIALCVRAFDELSRRAAFGSEAASLIGAALHRLQADRLNGHESVPAPDGHDDVR